MHQTHTNPTTRKRPSATNVDSKFNGRRGPFGRYKPEKEQAMRPGDVRETSVLAQLRGAWKDFKYNPEVDKPTNYEIALKLIGNLSYSAKDVEHFSIILAEFQEEEHFSCKAAQMLSALINNCDDNEFVIHTHHLIERIPRLGYRNTKNITIKGDTGDFLGFAMLSGQIIVEGNAGEWVGTRMRHGKIIVRGDAGETVGPRMEGGEIHLERRYTSLSHQMHGGKIFHKGVQIYPKPEGAN